MLGGRPVEVSFSLAGVTIWGERSRSAELEVELLGPYAVGGRLFGSGEVRRCGGGGPIRAVFTIFGLSPRWQ
ncbi:MAG: hypothetical protein ABWJ97_07735 [Thermoproteus sp.]